MPSFYFSNAHVGSQEDCEEWRVQGYNPIIAPDLLHADIPQTAASRKVVLAARAEASDIVHGRDSRNRAMVVIGPCSIHDPRAAIEYASRLKELKVQHENELLILMRAYLEKPITTVGWKGLVNDPQLNNTFDINFGLQLARKMCVSITDMGVPIASEMLDNMSPQFLADSLSLGAVGARTTESQLHRELASGLSFPVGFKNGTDGSLGVAIEAIQSANHSHQMLSITKAGRVATVGTNGNNDSFAILGGGRGGFTNYDSKTVGKAVSELRREGSGSYRVMIDCSHGNSLEDFRNQPKVAGEVAEQIRAGEQNIMGIMIESNLYEGRQGIPRGVAEPKEKLAYGVSVTDGCIGWEETVQVIDDFAGAVKEGSSKFSGRV